MQDPISRLAEAVKALDVEARKLREIAIEESNRISAVGDEEASKLRAEINSLVEFALRELEERAKTEIERIEEEARRRAEEEVKRVREVAEKRMKAAVESVILEIERILSG